MSRAPHRSTSLPGSGTAVLRREGGGAAPARVPAVVHEVLAAPGRPLDAPARSGMESLFGHDFSRVRVHAGAPAARAAAAMDARAFTVGGTIVFGAGTYAPWTEAGRRTLAHELAHTVQQGAGETPPGAALRVEHADSAVEHEAESAGTQAAAGLPVRVTGSAPRRVARERGGSGGGGAPAPAADAGGGSGGAPPAETPELTSRLSTIAANFRAMVAAARGRSANVAADNLEHFLAGTGTTRRLPVPWLRGFSPLTTAERTNQERFEGSFGDLAPDVGHGTSRTFHDHWSRMLTASQGTELYYASGTSTIRSSGVFDLGTIENEVSISGRVRHHWYDPYDWHAGLSAYVPGFGSISDEDALLMQRYRGARPYPMEADWDQTLSGHVTVRDYWFDDTRYRWSGP